MTSVAFHSPDIHDYQFLAVAATVIGGIIMNYRKGENGYEVEPIVTDDEATITDKEPIIADVEEGAIINTPSIVSESYSNKKAQTLVDPLNIQILKVLQKESQPISLKEILKKLAIDYPTLILDKHTINSNLYKMLASKKVHKSDDSRPLWSYN
jgi:hypothetical protein